MRVVIAPDKFKGTATAAEVASAIAEEVIAAGHEAIGVPMADGGDGTLVALGGANRVSTVTGPAGTPVEAAWRLSHRLAVIEMATASGLVVAGGPEINDPLNATTRGTGELILQAISRGAERIIVGLGGSATSDGGLGAVEVIGSPARLARVEVEVATDVTTKFVDAARIFGPQKGATPRQVAFLESRLRGIAERYRDQFGVDVEDVEGGGAAGGLAGGLHALGASISSGFDLIADEVGLFEQIEVADLVVTGEGMVDGSSFDGKVVGGVAALASETGIPLLVVAGDIADPDLLSPTMISLAGRFGLDAAMENPASLAAAAVAEYLAG